MTSSLSAEGSHLTELEIAAYLDRGVSQAERHRMESHLAGCAECRDSVSSAEELISGSRTPRRWLIGGSMLAAAAAILVVAMPAIRSANSTGDRPIVRDIDPLPPVTAYEPASTADRSNLRFTWGPVPGIIDYRLTLTESDGVVVWSGVTRDTTMALPPSIELRKDVAYVWTADAHLENGDIRSTGLRRLSITR